MRITLSDLNTKDLATLVQRTITTSDLGKYAVISNHPLLSELKKVYTEYDAVYTKSTYSGKGTDVASADRDRDVSFRALKNFLDGYRKMPSLSNYQFAEDLYQIFKLYDLSLDKMSYSSQTAQMKKLIEDLEKPENIQKLNALSLLPAFNEMKSKQDVFEQIFAEQAGANANLRNMKSASSIRKDLEKALRSYINFITVMKDVTGWELFYADINELVKAAKNSTVADHEKK
ncbi:hypothetical protein SAMN05421856_102318 [Chryseobacterium taichungense]|uniref:Uncharacterized protein n=1 Tax=Chryseobacterium taichungense TaxID=295069 RepID=A0A1H7XAY8_9FLAO|nr:DUF6261 family protein [Chryseobacterium taichungense]SEM30843.1 hypothetical protein SAMN05421856_102318 [Chryseobacterium taichungense]